MPPKVETDLKPERLTATPELVRGIGVVNPPLNAKPTQSSWDYHYKIEKDLEGKTHATKVGSFKSGKVSGFGGTLDKNGHYDGSDQPNTVKVTYADGSVEYKSVRSFRRNAQPKPKTTPTAPVMETPKQHEERYIKEGEVSKLLASITQAQFD